MTSERIQLWSCGGGRQSAGIAALIAEGSLPAPDHACMVSIEWEMASVWPYVEQYIIPALQNVRVPFHRIERREYATHDFWGGSDGNSILLPVYTDMHGSGKLPEYCSGEWKRDVVMRWAAQQPGWKEQGVDTWVGISIDEKKRIRAPSRKWIQPKYPLIFMRPTGVDGCLAAVKRAGWPEPPRSRCRHCPNQSDAEWAELSPDDFQAACALEDELRETDRNAYFHKSLIPLRDVVLAPKDGGCLTGGCQMGFCF